MLQKITYREASAFVLFPRYFCDAKIENFLWAGHVTRERSVRIPLLDFLRKPERRRRRRRCKDNIKVSRNGIGCVRMWMGT